MDVRRLAGLNGECLVGKKSLFGRKKAPGGNTPPVATGWGGTGGCYTIPLLIKYLGPEVVIHPPFKIFGTGGCYTSPI